MQLNDKIFVAGHRGLVGSALIRHLISQGYTNLLTASHQELDLTIQADVNSFFKQHQPQYVFLAAAKVGGIYANSHFPADFIYQNIAIQMNVIHAAYQHGVKRLLFLGSSCIYPRMAPQPIQESALLSGPLEPTNRAYAVAKISGIEQCFAYNRQYGTKFLAVMPTNLYGPGDNYDLQNSHVIPGMITKFHRAKEEGAPAVVLWGTGKPYREFLHCDDMADACCFLMQLDEKLYNPLCASDSEPPLINIGSGQEVTIQVLAEIIKEVVGYEGAVQFDSTKPDGTPRKLLDSTQLHALGWQPQIHLKAGFEITYQAFLHHLSNTIIPA